MKVYSICFTKNGFKILEKLSKIINGDDLLDADNLLNANNLPNASNLSNADNLLNTNNLSNASNLPNANNLPNKNQLKFNTTSKFYLSKRIYDNLILDEALQRPMNSDFRRANLREFTQEAWQEADAIIYIGATGIALRSIAKYIDKKDKDPAVLVIDEKGRYVIPLLSGHIGGANDLSLYLSEKLGSQAVITTATDINEKLAIDSWARDKDYKVHDTGKIAQVTAAILEDREVLLFAGETDSRELVKRGNISCLSLKDLDCQDIIEENQIYPERLADYIQKISTKIKESGLPAVVISPYDLGSLEDQVLHLIPKAFCVGVGARKDVEPSKMEDLYLSTLKKHCISPSAVISINSIDIKKEEKAILQLEHHLTKMRWTAKKNAYSYMNFFSADELKDAENLTRHKFEPSGFVKSITGVDNVCERAAVKGAALYKEEAGQGPGGDIQVLVRKTKGDSVTIAISKV